MTDQTVAPQNHFNASALLTIRESARTYQKLDLAYIAAGGAIVTAFKLSSSDIIEMTAQLWLAVVAIVVLLAYDTLLEKVIFLDWIASQQQSGKRLSSKIIISAISAQPMIHLIFIIVLVTGSLGYALGSHSAMQIYKGEAAIQVAVEHFRIKEKRLPNSIEELENKSPYTSQYFDLIGRSEIRIESTTDTVDKYRITFPGRDGKIGTPDDETVTAAIDLTKMYEKMRASKKED
ncbi:hypothetical protein ACVK1X_003859 [Pseudomonas sp. PvR086]|jgi:hypothetical protein|uniref:hypothetical protein n=1 Tax=Pseudomonas frederiksbergensis TaxID=104087 RepID=UPI00285DA92A|nr:hypothetical protein [Pseudomonas frederiksbergensis]MDR7104518.1 hypothetical protein [Pseudomonas frederiksbergensis]